MEEQGSKASAKYKAAAVFWQKFRTAVINLGIPENKAQWYEHWARQFSLSIPKIPLENRTPEHINVFLRNLESKQNIEEWQFKQAVESLKILYHDVFKFEWADALPEQHEIPRTIKTPKESSEILTEPPQTAEKKKTPLPDELKAIISKSKKEKDIYTKIRDEMRVMRYSSRTEKLYVNWVRRFLAFHENKTGSGLTQNSVNEYLEYLAREKDISPSTQHQALNALAFFYEQVLNEPFDAVGSFTRVKQQKKPPQILPVDEAGRLLNELTGTTALVAGLLYRSGLRLMECLRLRVQDIDFEREEITTRDSSGKKKQAVALPEQYKTLLQEHFAIIRQQHEQDLEQGVGEVYIWPALARKNPDAAREWGWQYVFPSNRLTVEPLTKKVRRHHIHETAIQNAVRVAAKKAGIGSQVNCQTLRHSSPERLF